MNADDLEALDTYSVIEDKVGRWWVKQPDSEWHTGAALTHTARSLAAGYGPLTLVHAT